MEIHWVGCQELEEQVRANAEERVEVYFHRNAVKEGLDFERLQESDRVALNLEQGSDGPQATTVIAPPPGQV